jgi:hypothetical protein
MIGKSGKQFIWYLLAISIFVNLVWMGGVRRPKADTILPVWPCRVKMLSE